MSEQYVLNNNNDNYQNQMNYGGNLTMLNGGGDSNILGGQGQDSLILAGPSSNNGYGQNQGQGNNQWFPPIPSLASLPVDKSKTDPKPAYYKLQFGDEVTGFSYYVRTLAVMIGRNVERHSAALPPPSITAPSVPVNPPLDPNQPSPPMQIEDIVLPQIIDFPTPPLHHHTSFSVPPQSPPHPSSAPLTTNLLNDEFAAPLRAQSEGIIDHSLPPDFSFLHDEDYPDIDMGEFGVLEELAEAVKVEQIKAASLERSAEPESRQSLSQSVPPTDNQGRLLVKLEEGSVSDSLESVPVGVTELAVPHISDTSDRPVHSQEDMQVMDVDHNQVMNDFSAMDLDLSQVKLENLDDFGSPPPPPPPPAKSSAPVEHVDVDLGPLKSVSRNHAKIEYKPDLGHFCLDIYGRNGAWVDDRYFVKGSIVPLAQGSQIQIATRIFSFVLPPSPISSPTYTHYALDGAPDLTEDLPYPYNLPASEVGYQEFYGEPGPGPSSAASMAARAPPAFNAFAAADGYGLGIEGVGEGSWNGWGSDDDDDDDSEEELDESGEEWEPSPTTTEKPKKVKSKTKAPKSGLVPGEDESELSSVASEPDDKKKKPKKHSVSSTTNATAIMKPKPIAPAPPQAILPNLASAVQANLPLPTTIAPSDMILPPVDTTVLDSRKSSVAENSKAITDVDGKSTSPKKVKKKKDKDKELTKDAEKDKDKDAKNTETAEQEKGQDKDTGEAKDNEGKDKSIENGVKVDEPKKKKKKKKPKPDEQTPKTEDGNAIAATVDEKEKDKDCTSVPPKKPKKAKTGEGEKCSNAAEDVKPDVPEKKKKKKKPKVDGEVKLADGKADTPKSADTIIAPAPPPTLAAALPPAPLVPASTIPATQPMPTLAAALGSAPSTTSSGVPPPTGPPPPAIRPPAVPGPTLPGQPTQPIQSGQPLQQGQVQPGQPIPPRPPMQSVRPPGQPQLPNGHYVRPPQPGQSGQPQSHPIYPPGHASHPQQYPVGPNGQPHPSQMVRPFPPGHPMHPQNRSASTPPAAPPSPVPLPPFYCTELNETPGHPGHIIVNVPIPPSGAGPRPPPGPLLGLDGNPFIGPPPLKPTQTFATIIHRSLQFLPRGRGTLGEVCNWVAGEWEWFRLNVDSGWQNSIRHNLSLNKAFLKVPRIPEDDPESKGSVWIIDPEEGPLFEEKQKRDAQKSASKDKNAESRREKERIRAEERAKKQREAAIEAARNPPQMIQRSAIPVAPRPIPRPIPIAQPAAPPAPPAPVSANAKGILQPKAKIVVVMQPITPAMRAKSVISTTDANGNPLPFVCDGTTLVLDQSTFGHLTSDIMDKLTLLGAAGAVDVLSAWVINKNKQQATKAAQAKTGTGAPGGVKNGTTVNNTTTVRPGVISSTTATTTSAVRPPVPPTASTANKPVVATSAATAKPPVGAKPAVNSATGKPIPGPAPPGTSLTKVIGMIAAVANAKGDVNTVGPNASALLRYIRVVGVDIDLRVAERIWATGVVPPLPPKKVPPKPNTAGAGTANGAVKPGTSPSTTVPAPRPVVGTTSASGANAASLPKSAVPNTSMPTPTSAATPKPVTTATAASTIPKLSSAPSATPAPAPTSVDSGTTPAAAGLKRKLEDGSPNHSTVGSSTNPIIIGGTAAGSSASGGSMEQQENKKPRLETSGA
ncbi:uncharacterized protein I206_102773 [Kwoniella pini CBS 10737]|uniref:Fork-head domain-containing protein n=1 Tax=Kwoniella pini CBS 10737 TaxID=1296096 RepID=A0A1B9I6B5_9TREE|nr:uncharacterized protein I206_03128 [Kwoniella pini CBS 10737]OCF51063.1 hypothetical protein I206_03128 [Kwoniella pini CBS 10737]